MDAAAKRLTALKRTFIPPPPLKQSRPRNVRFTAAGQTLVGVAGGLFAGAIGVGLALHREALRGGVPLWVPIAVACGVAAIGALLLRALYRERNFLAEGRVTAAVVTGHRSQKTQHGTHRTITYEFRLLNGAVRKGAGATSEKGPAVGSVICVVYDPDSPTRSKVYPLTFVTPDP